VKALENLKLVRVGMKQLHDDGGAIGLYGVSHGGPLVGFSCMYLISLSQRTVCLVALPGSAALTDSLGQA